jgi:deoxyribonuclease V
MEDMGGFLSTDGRSVREGRSLTKSAPMCSRWPSTREELIEEQLRLAALAPPPWRFEPATRVGGVFVCFARGGTGPGSAGDPAWAAACVGRQSAVVPGRAGTPYEPGLLALREGPLLEAAVRALPAQLDVLLVDATGRDHPRRSGLALHLGAVLDLPTVGVTHRPLVARASGPRRNDAPAVPSASRTSSSATGCGPAQARVR